MLVIDTDRIVSVRKTKPILVIRRGYSVWRYKPRDENRVLEMIRHERLHILRLSAPVGVIVSGGAGIVEEVEASAGRGGTASPGSIHATQIFELALRERGVVRRNRSEMYVQDAESHVGRIIGCRAHC